MPLKGLKGSLSLSHDSKTIKFAYVSFSMLSCLTFLICDLIVIVTYLMYLPAMGGFNISSATTLIFHSMGLLAYLGFFHLASKWQHIITKWLKMENKFLRHPYTSKDSLSLRRKVIMTSAVIAVLSLAEHSLFQGCMIYGFIDRRNVCGKETEEEPIAVFLKERFPYMFHAIPHIVFLWINQYVSFIGTVVWNFLDLFIIIIAIGIKTRFKQLYDYMKKTIILEEENIHYFQLLRSDYTDACELLSFVDRHVSILIFLSCVNNLYFVCNQLLNVFNPLRYSIDRIYFWYSTVYLLGRTFYLFYTAAEINEISKAPAKLLNSIYNKKCANEVERFLMQVNTEHPALSAMGFFNFTRQLILTMAGAIVTFELVMIQLNDISELSPLCGV
ncbi:Gr64a family protein [Megaselia abdita]